MKRNIPYLLFICMLPLLLQAKVLEVGPNRPYQQIQDAIEAAEAGDEIRILAGEYLACNLIISKPLRILGQGTVVVTGDGEQEVFIIDSDQVWIEGLEIRKAGKSQVRDLAAIRVRKHDHFTLRNNRIIDAYFGIYIENGKHGLIEGNELIGQGTNEMSTGNAIHCWYAEHLTIRGNLTQGYRDGIYLEFVNQSTIQGNTSTANIRYGLHFMFSNDNSYAENIFRSNGAGVAVMFSKRIQMLNNRFEHNWGRSSYGLLLKEIYDAEILHNHFIQNTIGIMLEGSTRLTYQHNEFQSNGWAIQITGGCLDNHFSKNNFKYNTLDLVVHSRMNNNTFHGNFWSAYSGYDLDRDGVGDVPHRPVRLFSYILSKSPESIVLLRSLFIDLLNFSEKVSPAFTPENVWDDQPLMQPVL